MTYRKVISAIYFLSILFYLSLFLPPFSHAASLGCAVTKVGNPAGQPPALPPGCEPGIPDLNCVSVSGGQYCQMPPSPVAANGSPYYKHTGTKWGSKEMITLLVTVAQKWKAAHPSGYLIINDITARPCPYADSDIRCGGYHITHWGGTAVDVLATATGSDCVADNIHSRCNTTPGTYNPQATIELGKLIVATGAESSVGGIRQIIYYDTTQGSNVITELKKLGPHIALLSNHKNHFHVDLKRANLPSCQTVSQISC